MGNGGGRGKTGTVEKRKLLKLGDGHLGFHNTILFTLFLDKKVFKKAT